MPRDICLFTLEKKSQWKIRNKTWEGGVKVHGWTDREVIGRTKRANLTKRKGIEALKRRT